MKKSFSRLCGILLLAALTTPLHAGKVLAEVEYFYAPDNTLVGKAFNGKRVNFEYDLRGQLLAVTDAEGNDLERYTYDPAGNRLSKTIGGVTTTYRYDNANQLVSSTSDGVTTQYRYDAAGRMVQAGDKTYYYNFGNNKVSEVKQNGKTIAKFEYNLDGQISKAIYGDKTEEFIWDGLALVWRSGVTYVNEPYVTGGNPILAGDDVLFNDMLGTTLAVNGNPVEMTSFGETDNASAFFTGKPMIEELGYSFLFRDYNPSHGRWTTADPLGYPDGWNNLAYVNNWVTGAIDRLGTDIYHLVDVTGCGHSACIIGNPEMGYFSYSYNGDGGGYGNNKNERYDNPQLQREVYNLGNNNNPPSQVSSSDYFPTGEYVIINDKPGGTLPIYAYKTPALALTVELLTLRPSAKEYTLVQKWTTTPAQDYGAMEAIKNYIGRYGDEDKYNAFWHNCSQAVDAALDGADVPHSGYATSIGFSIVFGPDLLLPWTITTPPLDFFLANTLFAESLDYNDFKNGLVE